MRQRPGSLMLFAAGFGTRMRHLTKDRPKPLVQVSGKALLDHATEWSDGLSLTRVVNTHYLADQIDAHVQGTDIKTSHEPTILDTGGGLKNALPLLGPEPVLTMNTDAVWRGSNPIKILLDHWDPDRMDALLMCVPHSKAIGHDGPGGFVFDASSRLTKGPGEIYTGLQIIRTDLLSTIDTPVFSMHALWDKLLSRGSVYGHLYDGTWCDVGSPEGVALAEEMLAGHV